MKTHIHKSYCALIATFIVLLESISLNAQSLDWVKQVGGAGDDVGQALITDDFGNILIVGEFYGTVDFDPGVGTTNLTSSGTGTYVQKLDTAGNFLWARQFELDDYVKSIASDGSGNVYMSGSFNSTTDFDPGTGIFNLTNQGGVDFFVLKLDANGNFVWATQVGGSSWFDKAYSKSITLDPSGNVYTMGDFTGGNFDFDPGAGVYNMDPTSGYDIFIQKLDGNGNFLWAKNFGEPNHSLGLDITTDVSGNIYTTGEFYGMVDFDPGVGIANLPYVFGSGTSVFIQKLDLNGNFLWVKGMGGPGDDRVNSIAVDPLGNVYTTGSFSGTMDFDPGIGTANLTPEGWYDVFVQKLDANGNYLWANNSGGASADLGKSITIDNTGNAYITGYFASLADFDPGAGTMILIGSGGRDMFIQKLGPNGNFLWAKGIGGFQDDEGNDIAVDVNGGIYLTGYFRYTTDFDPNAGTHYLTSAAFKDSYVLKLKPDICANITLVIDSLEDVSCSGLGFVSAHTLYGLPPYSYEWDTDPIIYDSLATVDSAGYYELTVTDANACTYSSTAVVNGPGIFTGWDFDVHLTAQAFRPGITSTIWLDVFNDACIPATGQLILVLDTLVSYSGANPSPDLITGDSLIWNFSNLTYDSIHLQPQVFVTTDLNANIGDLIVFDVYVSPVAGDVDGYNNTKQYVYDVVNSYDPNDIQVYPQGPCDVGYIVNETLLTYTIRFQNTGNADAINIYILDSLDSALDISTIRVVGQSHQSGITELLPENVLKFRFDNIMLPDSNNNEPLSHGFVRYEAEPLPGLPNGTVIKNSASIYFDYNAPIKTNTVFNTIIDILPDLDTILNVATCSNYVLNSNTYTASGTYIQKLNSFAGCDSTITLNLTINSATASTITQTACDSYISPSGAIYSTSGVYSDVIPNSKGCDSTITINLTVNSPTASSITETACGSYTTPSGSVHTNTGTYTDVIPNAMGCDSAITINLTVNSPSTSLITASVCTSYIAPSGAVYTASGTYTDVIPNAIGCDSTIAINLSVNSPTSSTITEAACDTYTSPSGSIYTNSGIYTEVIPNFKGCDSTITINLTIGTSSSTSAISTIACNSYTAPSGAVYTSSGNYIDVIPNAQGCDSTISISVIINSGTTGTITETVCESYTAPSGAIFTSSGIYTDVIPNSQNCDSTITIDLTVNNSTTSIITESACETYTTPGGTVHTTTGVYTDVIPNTLGCDSTITIDLTINSSTTSAISETACESYTAPSGAVLSSSGIYADLIANSTGCDSTITIDLTINNATSSTITETVCDSYTSTGGSVYTSSGTYTDVIPNTVGCDSTITLNLTINAIDKTVSQSGTILTANATGATYQWLDCNNEDTPITGETNQSFTASQNGNYAVALTENSCTDTSSCYSITGVGISGTHFSSNISIYPNPAGDKVSIALNVPYQKLKVTILNVLGQEMISAGFDRDQLAEFDLSDLKAGVYFIEIKADEQSAVFKIIKE